MLQRGMQTNIKILEILVSIPPKQDMSITNITFILPNIPFLASLPDMSFSSRDNDEADRVSTSIFFLASVFLSVSSFSSFNNGSTTILF
jgi:hypothetical protein